MLSKNVIKLDDLIPQVDNFDNSKPLVSVYVTAYNLAEYIEGCIISILNQVVDFNYEIVIGEDFSSDNKKTILEIYEKKYPEKIRVIYNEMNLGMMANFINTIESFVFRKNRIKNTLLSKIKFISAF